MTGPSYDPELANIIDLDAIIGEVEPRTVLIHKKPYFANPDPPVGLLYDMYKIGEKFGKAGDADADPDEIMEAIQRILTGIFGADAGAEIFNNCGMSQVVALLGVLMDAYAAEGKAPGSSRASRRAGANSSRTSTANTKSTSAKRVSAKNGSAAAISHA